MFDFLIIETYGQLTGVALALAVVVAIVPLLRLKARATSTHAPVQAGKTYPSKTHQIVVAPQRLAAPNDTPTQSLRAADQREFDRLANMISTVSLRAEHVSETQSKAALKLDTVEMAVHRLLLDVDGLVDLPRYIVPLVETTALAPVTRATLAA